MEGIGLVTGLFQAGTGAVQLIQSSAENKAKLRNNFKHMEESMDTLQRTRKGVEKEFQKYWFPGNRIVSWLHKVKTINGEVKNMMTLKLLNKEESYTINIPQYDLVQNTDRVCANIDLLIQEGKACETDLKNRKADRVVKLDAPINIANIPALKKHLDLLLEYLKYDNFNSIKVHGEKGIGKSVLIQHVNNYLANANEMFDIVIWIQGSRYRDSNRYSSIEAGIQHIIAERLRLDILGIEDVNVVASMLRAELEDTKYLLLFDDVMEGTIKLETIGIPTKTKGSKIVYATCKIVPPFSQPFFNIKVNRLDEVDSWKLFENIWMTENDQRLRREIQSVARRLVQWCSGYFSLIELVAKLFKSEASPASWSNYYEKLNKPAKRGDVYMQPLKNFWHLSYDVLEENQKICFLFSVLYPEEYKIPIDCLFDCWAANNLLGNDVIGEDILYCLLEKALLNVSSDKQYVTINKLCRGAAMNILQEHLEYKCLVVEKASEDVPNYSWEDMHWISLADSGIEVLPDTVNCPKLTTLFLQKNLKLKKVSSSLFDEMKELIVLDLHKAGFEFVLPMKYLKKLKVLYVNGCAMSETLPFRIEGDDNMLEVLDIRGCIVNKIPQDIKRLSYLRRLIVSIDGSDTRNQLVISELSSLKELFIDVKSNVVHKDRDSYMRWCHEVIKRNIEKAETLETLTTLKFCFKYDTVDVIQLSGHTLRIFVPEKGSLQHIWNNRDFHYSALEVYIGFRMTPNLEIPYYIDTYENFVLSCDKIADEPVIEEVLLRENTLIWLKDSSMEHLDQTVVPEIQHCLVQRCNKIETLMHTHGFANLKTLIISECSQLKVLFSNDVARQVMYIEHLEIRDCSAIEEINMLSDSGGDTLPNLTTFVLHDLRMLKKICPDLEWPSVTTIKIHECPLLTEIPLNRNNARNLCQIKVEETWWKNVQLDQEIKQIFEPYCEFSN